MFFKKTEERSELCCRRKVFLCGLHLYNEEKNFFLKQIVFFNRYSLKIKSYHRYPFYDRCFKSFRKYSKEVLKLKCIKNKEVVLWVDHSLGGGTQSYSLNKFKECKDKYVIVRLQYFHIYRSFVISFPNGEFYTGFTLEFDEVKTLFSKLNLSKIVLNTIVNYRNIKDVLIFVHEVNSRNRNLKITYNVHDFFFICPNCNLISSNKKFCGFSYDCDCVGCVKKYKSLMSEYDFKLFYDEFNNISEWRKMWQNFLLEDVSEVVCFSKSSFEIINKFYPKISSKLRLVPHYVRPLRQVNVNHHNTVNIAVLGKVDTIPKGKEFIEKLSYSIYKYNKDHESSCYDSHLVTSNYFYQNNCSDKKSPNVLNKKVQLLCIGDYVNAPKNMIVTGTYKREELPNILEQDNVDLILIPSIWAETFSYTTSEAIAMNVPVACFNLGGQADQVSVYSKGLILDLADSSDVALKKILDFLSSLS